MSPSAEETAVQIAVLIDRDPIMAAQIKNHLPKARILEVLDLDSEAQQAADQAVIQDPDPLNELRKNEA